MTIKEAAREYRLPVETTPELLEERWRNPIRFDNKVLLGVHYWTGTTGGRYFGAVYEFTTDETTCEDPIRLTKVSEEGFSDEGHAIRWGMDQ